jgi:ribosomal protein L16 Arg81 hydroxylase
VKKELSIAKKVYANVYFTPASSQALKRHSDWQDVFVLQIHGEKRWQLFDNEYKFPINNEQTQQMVAGLEQATPVADLLLKPGDLLYVPRGLAHEVHTLDTNSLHISLTVETFSNYDVMVEALKQAADTQSNLRDNIPLDFFSNPSGHLAAMFDSLAKNTQFSLRQDSQDHLSGSNHNASLKGYFLDQEKAEEISKNTLLILRKHLRVSFIPQATAYIIATNQYKFKVDDANEELDFIRKGGQFTLTDLPGALDQEDKQALVELLIQTGIVTFV